MVTANTTGQITVYIKEISNKEFDMDMVSGKMKTKYIKDIIDQTRNKVLVYIYGKINKYIRDNLEMIIVRVMDNILLL